VINGFGFMIESLVAMLLLVTIGYCVVLNSRLKRLRADERILKATIAELITATEIAERAVSGLKTTAHECDQTLGEHLRTAERCKEELGLRIRSADFLLKRLCRVLAASASGELAAEPDGFAAEPHAAEGLPAGIGVGPATAFDVVPMAVHAAAPRTAPAARPAPDPKNVAAAAQAFAERARTRLNSLAA
jgi:hypothetical protein